MKYFRRLMAVILSFVLLLGLVIPAYALGPDDMQVSIQETYINPLYADTVTSDALSPLGRPWSLRTTAETYFSDPLDAAAYLRQYMTQRQETIVIPYITESYDGDANIIRALLRQIAEEAIRHTGMPNEGDYLMWQYAGWNANAEASVSDGVYYWTFTYTYTYYTSAEEEALVTETVDALLEELNVFDQSPYRKVRAIYDYICGHVVYDREHLDTPEYKHQFTAYAALIDGTAVCQGYALLFYRLALELGMDSRLISGLGRDQRHGWNIVKLDGLYYDLDATWDAGDTEYTYFLRSPGNFVGHSRDEEYDTEAFHADYPMADTDYIPDRVDTCEHNYEIVLIEPSCLEDGLVTYHCTDCGYSYVGDIIEATGHSWDEGEQIQPPTDTAPGAIIYHCLVCEATKTETLRPLDSVYRIYGKNRYETSIKVAETLKQLHGVEKFPVILVASGTNFADALSGSYLANKKDAPLLLVNRHTVTQVSDYIRENLAEDGLVYLLGGIAAVPEEMVTALEGINVKRLQGSDRYETNLAILKEAGIDGEDILVCTGLDFADSLSASALERPILLVRSALNDIQKEFLSTLNGNDIYIIGGENAVDAHIAEELTGYGYVTRIQGTNRYETSVELASAFSPACRQIVAVYGHNFPDGLCGGILAAALDAPLILTQERSKAYAVGFTESGEIRSGVVLGGSSLVSDETVREIFAMAEDDEIIIR